MKPLYLFIFALLLPALPASAQEMDRFVNIAADRFSHELAGLKMSTERLSSANADLGARSAELRGRIVRMRGQLQKSADETNNLTRSALKLQEKSPSRSRKIAQMERDIFDAEARLDRLTVEIRTSQSAIDGSSKEDARLDARLARLGLLPPPQPREPQEPPLPPDASHAKEKLRLLKMIDESKQRQQELYEKVADAKKRKPMTQVVSVQTSGDKPALQAQIDALQAQIEQLTKPQPPPEDPYGPAQLAQAQQQVKDLKKNYEELQELAGRMQQKAQKVPLSQDQRNERNRLRASLDDLLQNSRKLRSELGRLRKQMVSLDKRKTALGK